MNNINTLYDLIIVGSGPAGEGAAMMAAKHGKRVLVVEKHPFVGGGCTHWGTIPSKTIRQAIVSLINLYKLPYVGQEYFDNHYTFKELIDMSQNVIKTQVSIRENHYERNQVSILIGTASFVDDKTLRVVHENKDQLYRAPHYILATGSSPYHDPQVNFSHPLILDSNTVLNLNETPRSICICGAGIIGVEYACIFKSLGIKVDIINNRKRVMDFLDDEITDAFNYHMRDIGVVIRNNEVIQSVDTNHDSIVVHLESGKSIRHQYLLWAQGRVGNTNELEIKTAGLEANKRGYIKVNENYQTKISHIYAVGDLTGWPSLAGTAYDQGRIASAHICQLSDHPARLGIFPTGIYTTPEISCIGKNEKELTSEKIPYEVGKANFKSVAKAQILGDTTGVLKILFHRQTKEILGIHCFGRQAADVIHIGQAIMKAPPPHNTIDYFIETTFNYPTMAEAYRIAAYNGLNRL